MATKMTREEALNKVRQMSLPKETMEILEALAPELAESEDERIRKRLIEYFEGFRIGNAKVKWEGLTVQDVLDWLEKQKENPKSADSIPSDCVSDVRCEDRWHKVGDSLPDNGRLVLAKDCLGNVLLARYDGENWEVDVYDNEDHYCHNSISKWCEIPSEKQKEQKPVHFELKAGKWYICHRAFCCRADHLTVKEGERFQCEKDGIVKGFVIKEPEKYFKECSAPAPMEDEQKEQKQEKFPPYVTGFKGDPDPAGTSDLEEAAEKYIQGSMCDLDDGPSTGLAKESFIAGAKWQKEQKSAEWDEDEEFGKILNLVYKAIRKVLASFGVYSEDEELLDSREESIDYYSQRCAEEILKSLRPSWKPSEAQLPGIEDPGIPGKDFIPVDWVDACEKYGKWKIVKVK